MKRALTVLLVLFAGLSVMPSAAQAGQYDWSNGCFAQPMIQRCWATNFDPNAGNFGSQMRTNNLHSLPTWSGTFSYGSSSLPATTCGGDPMWGGDHIGAGSNANCSTNPPTCAYSNPAISCHPTPATFVTENFVGWDGAWRLAMGGGDKCMTDGNSVPCNLQHKVYPYDCETSGPGCTSAGPQGMPFTWGFGANATFEVSTLLHVTAATGPWHHFLCANLKNSVTGAVVELCDETYNSTGNKMPQAVYCNGGNFITYWQPAGVHSPYMNTAGPHNSSPGVHMNPRWTMTRDQFINILNVGASQCGFPADMNMDNWRLHYSQNGMEIVGPAGYGTGITWEFIDEKMITHY